MTNLLSNLSRALPLLPVLAPNFVAQGALAQDFWVPTARITRTAILAGPTAQPLGRLAAGNLSPDLRSDAILVQGGQLLFLSGIDCLGAGGAVQSSQWATAVKDALILPQLAGEDRCRVLVCADSGPRAGLSEVVFEYEQENGSADGFAFTPNALPAWADVRRLAMGDPDRDGLTDILGLSGSSVLHCERDASAGWTSLSTMVVGPGFSQLEILPWTNATTDGLVLVGGNQVKVIDWAGGTLDSFSLPNGVSCWTGWYCGVAGAGRLAVVTTDTTGIASLHVLGKNGYAEPSTVLGNVAPTAVAMSDFLGDGQPDLALIERNSPYYFVLFNFGGPQAPSLQTFDLTNLANFYWEECPLDAGLNMSAQTGGLVSQDIDGDSDQDLLFACDATDDIHIKRNPLNSEVERLASLALVSPNYFAPPSDRPAIQPLGLHIRPPVIPLPAATHVEALLYQDQGTGNLELVGQRVWELGHLLEISPEPDPIYMTSYTELLESSAVYATTVQTPYPTETANYQIYLRYVQRDANGSVVAATPEVAFSFIHSRGYENGSSTPNIGNSSPPTPAPDPNDPPRNIPPPPGGGSGGSGGGG